MHPEKINSHKGKKKKRKEWKIVSLYFAIFWGPSLLPEHGNQQNPLNLCSALVSLPLHHHSHAFNTCPPIFNCAFRWRVLQHWDSLSKQLANDNMPCNKPFNSTTARGISFVGGARRLESHAHSLALRITSTLLRLLSWPGCRIFFSLSFLF